MLTIRLQRTGKRNRPEFRIVLAEKESSAEKKVTEIIGHYNPRTKDFSIKQDRFQYWMAQHVALSPTAHNLFVNQKLVDAPKVKAFSIPAKAVEPATPAVAPATEQVSTTPAELEPAETAETPAEVEVSVPTPEPTPVTETPTSDESPADTTQV